MINVLAVVYILNQLVKRNKDVNGHITQMFAHKY